MSEVAVAGIHAPELIPVAALRVASRLRLSAEVLYGASAYEILLPDWERLAVLQSGTTLFQTPALLSAWARHFAPHCARSLATVVVRHNGRPVLIWPLAIERHALVRVARGAGAPITQYDEILIDPETDGKAALAAALDALRDTVRPDLVYLEQVRRDSVLHAALGGEPPIGGAEAAPFVDLSEGLDAALARRKSCVAKKQRKRVKRFAKEGAETVAIAADAGEAEAWLTDALTLKRDWLQSNGQVSRAFVRGETRTFLSELARTHSGTEAKPRMVVAKLSLDGRTAAIEMGFLHRGVFQLYLRAFAPEFAHLGSGNVLTERMLAWCAENGVARYDMLAPRSRNKSEWQSGEVEIADFALPLTGRGKLYAASVPARLAPALRRAFYALPQRIRATVAGMTLKM